MALPLTRQGAFSRRTFEVGPKAGLAIRRGQFDPAQLVSGVEAQRVTGPPSSYFANTHAIAFGPRERVTQCVAAGVALNTQRR